MKYPMNINRRNLILAASSVLPLGSTWAQADYPNRPVKIISPVAAGSGGDTLIRRLGEPIGKLLGQPMVIENKPGAQSAIGARFVAKAPNDGYTLMLGGNSFVANVHMLKEPGYDPLKDFTHISLLGHNPLLLTVNADLPVRNLQEFIKYAKERPGKLNFGVGNSGSLVAAQLMQAQAGIDAVAVNYPGMAQAATDLLGGRVDFLMLDAVIAQPFIQSGKLRALGITSKQRLATFPDVAPLAERGLPGYEWVGWVGLFGPAGMPVAITRRINQAVVKVVADPAIGQFMANAGMIPHTSTPEQLQAHIQDQIKLWGRWTKDAGLTPT
ncbi:MAG: hypothetical protein RL300_275 [Pseudomonadota bacterium]|jgi:tripartite-type tricarboxylate transporter receptor subunit TctC